VSYLSLVFSLVVLSLFGIHSQFFVSCLWLSGLRVALVNSMTHAQAVQMAYNSSQQELEELRAATLEAYQEVKEGEEQAGSSMVSRLRALGAMSPGACATPSPGRQEGPWRGGV
jgi:hypothetical protein